MAGESYIGHIDAAGICDQISGGRFLPTDLCRIAMTDAVEGEESEE